MMEGTAALNEWQLKRSVSGLQMSDSRDDSNSLNFLVVRPFPDSNRKTGSEKEKFSLFLLSKKCLFRAKTGQQILGWNLKRSIISPFVQDVLVLGTKIRILSSSMNLTYFQISVQTGSKLFSELGRISPSLTEEKKAVVAADQSTVLEMGFQLVDAILWPKSRRE